ncbi:MAG: hypothetical protein D6746_08645 [Bacteroidetes bacterium]|nr:MAG: hypothetical protein D6746_08645 [Bacteroidota bacterium]
MGENNDKNVFVLNKNTAVSLGLALVIVGAVSYVQVALINLSAGINSINRSIESMEKRMSSFERNYMTKDEVLLRLQAIDSKLEYIAKEIKDKKK